MANLCASMKTKHNSKEKGYTMKIQLRSLSLFILAVCTFYTPTARSSESSDRKDAVLESIKTNRLEEVKKALCDGFQVDAIYTDYDELGSFNTTPLCTAIDHGHAEMVRLLIEHGADVELAPEEASLYHPLHKAVMRARDSRIVQILLKAKASPDSLDDMGFTPFHQAIYLTIRISDEISILDREIINIIQALLDHGGSISIESQLNETPLSLAQRITTTDCHNTLAQRVLTLLQEHERWSPARRAWIDVIVRHANHSALSVNPKTGIGAFMPTATLPSASSGEVDGDPDEADNDLPPLEYVSSDDD